MQLSSLIATTLLLPGVIVKTCTATSNILPAHNIEPPEISLQDLRARYGDHASRYEKIDGVEIHYKDQGTGDETLILLHASWVNLNAWESLVERLLEENFRVVRMDFPNQGLSGPETIEPEGGKFDLIERNLEVLRKFVNKLKLDKFHVVATSTGAVVGFRFASRYHNKIRRLILINSAGMPRTSATNPNRPNPLLDPWKELRIKPREYYMAAAGPNFPSFNEAPSWFVDLMFDLNRCAGRTPQSKYMFETGDPQATLGQIYAPTLILWGMLNPTVSHLEADVIEHWMTSAPSLIKKYKDLGHYPYVEDPGLVNQDIINFLKGKMDDDLRVTRREKAEIL